MEIGTTVFALSLVSTLSATTGPRLDQPSRSCEPTCELLSDHLCRYNRIPVRITSRLALNKTRTTVNIRQNNLIKIPTYYVTSSQLMFVPTLLLSNVMSLAPKIDELHEVINSNDIDIACITETWLRNHIDDNIVTLSGFRLVRLDRSTSQHGGVCMYVKNDIQCKILRDLLDDKFEVVWVHIRPNCLPRGIPCIVMGTLYHPPTANNQEISDHLLKCLSVIESRFPNCGIILLGDFNNLNVCRFKRNFRLKQIVNFPTRGHNVLDLILTNLSDYYATPTKLAPLGLSDHVTVKVSPIPRSMSSKRKTTIKTRDISQTKRLAIRSYLEAVDIQSLIDN